MLSKETGYKLLEILEKEGLFKTKDFEWLYEDFKEVEYVYVNEEVMLKHREQMENNGYKTFSCGTKSWFSGDKVTNPNSTFFKFDVRVHTATYGIKIDGLLEKISNEI